MAKSEQSRGEDGERRERGEAMGWGGGAEQRRKGRREKAGQAFRPQSASVAEVLLGSRYCWKHRWCLVQCS